MKPIGEQIIGLASDHAGYELKQYIKAQLEASGAKTVDYGCDSTESCDYPDYAHKLGYAVERGEVERGIAVCGTGNGISMALNHHKGIRSALAWEEEIARLARAHNDANVVALPGRFVAAEKGWAIAKAFLETDFEGGRHERRVGKIALG